MSMMVKALKNNSVRISLVFPLLGFHYFVRNRNVCSSRLHVRLRDHNSLQPRCHDSFHWHARSTERITLSSLEFTLFTIFRNLTVWVSFSFFLSIIGKERWKFLFYKNILHIIYIDTCLSCLENKLEELSLSDLRQTSSWRKLTTMTESCHPSLHPQLLIMLCLSSLLPLSEIFSRGKKCPKLVGVSTWRNRESVDSGLPKGRQETQRWKQT